jgi:intein/homing endonuclease
VLCKPNISENRKDKKPWYNLLIKGGENLVRVSKTLQLLVSNKKQKLLLIGSRNSRDLLIRKKHYNTDYLFDKVVNIKPIGEQIIYNLSAGLSHTYLANDIITHNTAGDNDSDFGSAQELVYNPTGYHIEAFENVYDKIG